MASFLFHFVVLICAARLLPVWSETIATGLYGETIEVPCFDGGDAPEDTIFIKWKYIKDDGSSADLLVKQAHKTTPTIQATDSYAQRVDINANSSLLISEGTLTDQRTFICMAVSAINLWEYPVDVLVYKTPSPPQITDKAQQLDIGKLEKLGKCQVKDANPAAGIQWTKNGQALASDGKDIIISSDVEVDPATGLSSTYSSLQYVPTKADLDAQFACQSSHQLLSQPQESVKETFTIRYPTENLVLHVVADTPIEEGDNVTLKCQADGNPLPSSFDFYLKGQKVTVTDSDSYTLSSIRRESAGEYKCSLVDNEEIVAQQSIVVAFLDLNLSPTGKVVKTVGETLEVKVEKSASGEPTVLWSKDGKVIKAPVFEGLTYADSGVYACEASLGGIAHSQSFELLVEGPPKITRLEQQGGPDSEHKVLTCEASGVPQPIVTWNINGTQEEPSDINERGTNTITIVPEANVTVTCTASNRLGEDLKSIDVTIIVKEEVKEPEGKATGAETKTEDETEDETETEAEAEADGNADNGDQAKLIVGIVLGLIIAAAVVGLIYWIYMKKSRQGSWKTGEKEDGSPEEEKQLDDSNHKEEA